MDHDDPAVTDMNVLQPQNAVFLVGFIAYIVIRGVYARRTKMQEKSHRQVDGLEKFLMLLVIPPSLLLPVLYLFTPLLTFADYRLPTFAPWCGTVVMLAALWLFWRIPCRLGPELVSHAGAAQRAPVRRAWRLPFDPPSDVCVDFPMGHRPGAVAAELACRLVRIRAVRRDVRSSHAAQRTHDVRILRPAVSRLHAANGPAVSADRPYVNAFRNSSRLFGTAVLKSSLPSNSSET